MVGASAPAGNQCPPAKAGSGGAAPCLPVFGWRHHPIRGTFKLHSGIDIPTCLGAQVMASASGLVRFAGRSAMSIWSRLITAMDWKSAMPENPAPEADR